MKISDEAATLTTAVLPEEDIFFDMSNLSRKRTGLPFVVWISPSMGAPHDVRVKVSQGPKVLPSELVSVAIRPEIRVVGGSLDASSLKLLRQWVELNYDAIVGYWDGEIESTEDAIAAMRPIG